MNGWSHRKRARTRSIALALSLLLAGPALAEPPSVPVLPGLQTRFDPIGPAVVALPGPNGRTLHYVDTGEAGWRAVVYIGGTGTSARAMLMTGYLETMRRQLHIRLISVERNGFGDTAFDPAWTLADYARDVRAVVDRLGVKRFAVVAISGGGPYAAHVAAAMPDRIISLHFAAALADRPAGCSAHATALAATVDNPQSWWAFPAHSPTHAIPGFADRAYDEGARAFFIRGQMGDAAPELAEMQRYCTAHLADLPLTRVMAPVFTYYGLEDPLVPPSNGDRWRAWLGGPVTDRRYPGEGHDVQYRHWDQVLIDLSGLAGTGPQARTLTCVNGHAQLSRKPATISGLCLWQAPH